MGEGDIDLDLYDTVLLDSTLADIEHETGNGFVNQQLPAPVGGFWVPINKTELLAPWITLASLITVATASIVYVKNRKKKQQN